LWQPLDLAQTAPPLFLVVTKALASVFGYGEQVLRVLPLLAGCLLLPLAWFVSRQLLEREESVLVVALLAFSPTAILYDNFFKQYSGDMLASLAIIGVTLSALRQPTPRRLIAVGVTGVVCVLFSSTSILLLAGAGAALMVRSFRARERRAMFAVSAIGAVWLSIFGILLRTTYRRLQEPASPIARYMHDYWQKDFLYLTPGSLRRAMAHLFDGVFFALPGDERFGVRTVILAVLLVLGILTLARVYGREVAALLAVPLLLLVLGSIAGRYPLATRLVLFTAPLTALCIAAGVGALLRRLPEVGRLALVGALLIAPARLGFYFLRHPLDPASGENRELLRAATSLSGSGADALYVPGLDVPTFVYYARADTALARRLLRPVDLGGPATAFATSYDLGDNVPAPPDSALTAQIGTRKILVARTKFQSDTSWDEREALRLKEAAPCTDVYGVAGSEETAALRAAITSGGGSITNERHVGAHTNFRACYPRE
jgi:hypothetical protein